MAGRQAGESENGFFSLVLAPSTHDLTPVSHAYSPASTRTRVAVAQGRRCSDTVGGGVVRSQGTAPRRSQSGRSASPTKHGLVCLSIYLQSTVDDKDRKWGCWVGVGRLSDSGIVSLPRR